MITIFIPKISAVYNKKTKLLTIKTPMGEYGISNFDCNDDWQEFSYDSKVYDLNLYTTEDTGITRLDIYLVMNNTTKTEFMQPIPLTVEPVAENKQPVGYQVIGKDLEMPAGMWSFCVYTWERCVEEQDKNPHQWGIVPIYMEEIVEPTFINK